MLTVWRKTPMLLAALMVASLSCGHKWGHSMASIQSTSSDGGSSGNNYLVTRFGIAAAAAALVIVFGDRRRRRRPDPQIEYLRSLDWSPAVAVVEPKAVTGLTSDLANLDPQFSLIVFDDFIATLFGKVQRARAQQQLRSMAAYLSDAAIESLAEHRVESVDDCVVREVAILYVRNEGVTRVGTRIEAAITETHDGQRQTVFVKEVWVLVRARGLVSRPPERAQMIDCPQCFAPLQTEDSSKCPSCERYLRGGIADWFVDSIGVLERHQTPATIGEAAPIVGPLRAKGHPQADFEALAASDPGLTFADMRARIAKLFEGVQSARASREWSVLRAFIGDQAFSEVRYWMMAYDSLGQRRVLENPKLERMELSEVGTDAFFEWITVRMVTSSNDYTLNPHGEAVAGNRNVRESFGEYWTLMRRRGVKSSQLFWQGRCGNCGKELSANSDGTCSHCERRVCTGEWEWVLEKIVSETNG